MNARTASTVFYLTVTHLFTQLTDLGLDLNLPKPLKQLIDACPRLTTVLLGEERDLLLDVKSLKAADWLTLFGWNEEVGNSMGGRVDEWVTEEMALLVQYLFTCICSVLPAFTPTDFAGASTFGPQDTSHPGVSVQLSNCRTRSASTISFFRTCGSKRSL